MPCNVASITFLHVSRLVELVTSIRISVVSAEICKTVMNKLSPNFYSLTSAQFLALRFGQTELTEILSESDFFLINLAYIEICRSVHTELTDF